MALALAPVGAPPTGPGVTPSGVAPSMAARARQTGSVPAHYRAAHLCARGRHYRREKVSTAAAGVAIAVEAGAAIAIATSELSTRSPPARRARRPPPAETASTTSQRHKRPTAGRSRRRRSRRSLPRRPPSLRPAGRFLPTTQGPSARPKQVPLATHRRRRSARIRWRTSSMSGTPSPRTARLAAVPSTADPPTRDRAAKQRGSPAGGSRVPEAEAAASSRVVSCG